MRAVFPDGIDDRELQDELVRAAPGWEIKRAEAVRISPEEWSAPICKDEGYEAWKAERARQRAEAKKANGAQGGRGPT
jgi:hypothetical protein